MTEATKLYQPPNLEPIHYIPHVLLIVGGPGSGKTKVTDYINEIANICVPDLSQQNRNGLATIHIPKAHTPMHNMIGMDVDNFRKKGFGTKHQELTEAHAHHLLHAQVALKEYELAVALSGVYGKEKYRADKRLFAETLGFDFLTVLVDVPEHIRRQRILTRALKGDPTLSTDVKTNELFDQIEKTLSYTNIDFVVNGLQPTYKIWQEIVSEQKRRDLIQQ